MYRDMNKVFNFADEMKIHPLKCNEDENRKSEQSSLIPCDICAQNVEQKRVDEMSYRLKSVQTGQVISFLICDDCVGDSVHSIDEKKFTMTIDSSHHFGGVWKRLDIA